MVQFLSLPRLCFSIFKRELHTSADPPLMSLLNQCSNFKHVNSTHGFMVPRGLDQDNILLCKFIETCSLLGFADYAYSVFTHTIHPDIYICNTMIKALSRTRAPEEAILLYNRIQSAGYRPDTYSFPFVLKAVVHLLAVDIGREIHGQTIRFGLDADVHVMTGLIQMYSACGVILDARRVFDSMSNRDVISWNAMIAGYAKVGDMDSAGVLFENMPERNVISWTTVIAGYAQANRPTEAIQVFQKMQLEDIEPDDIAMLAGLSACAHLGALELGKWIHDCIDKRGIFKIVPLANALIDMYVKSGSIEKALEVFETMKHRSVITWTTIIAGLALHGYGKEALAMFARMERARVRPNEVTFLAILSACCHVGLVEMGRWYFNIMCSRYQIKPMIEHYGCMVDLLGRAGKLKEALELIKNMPFKPNGAIWGSLLAASRVHGDIELGECALRHLIEVEPHNSGNYTLLSNIYAAFGRWHEVGLVRKAMQEKGVKKMPGGSSVEANGIVHEFIAGDKSHPQFERIQGILHNINREMKMAGYIPREHAVLLEYDEFENKF